MGQKAVIRADSSGQKFFVPHYNVTHWRELMAGERGAVWNGVKGVPDLSHCLGVRLHCRLSFCHRCLKALRGLQREGRGQQPMQLVSVRRRGGFSVALGPLIKVR